MPTGTPPIVTPGGITSGAGVVVVVGDVVVPVEVEPVVAATTVADIPPARARPSTNRTGSASRFTSGV